MAEQTELVDIIGKFTPKIVKMAPDGGGRRRRRKKKRD